MIAPSIGFGHVVHQRLRPARHGFTYPVLFLRVPVSRLDALKSRWLSLDRFNLFGFHRRDFGPCDGSELEPWIRGLLKARPE